jgi:hypothetical protein
MDIDRQLLAKFDNRLLGSIREALTGALPEKMLDSELVQFDVTDDERAGIEKLTEERYQFNCQFVQCVVHVVPSTTATTKPEVLSRLVTSCHALDNPCDFLVTIEKKNLLLLAQDDSVESIEHD